MKRGGAAMVAVAIASAVAVLGSTGCAAAKAPVRDAPLVTAPLTQLAPAASLEWLLDLEPRALLGDASLAPALHEIMPDATLDAITRAYAVDLRGAEEVALASYPGSKLALVRGFVEPAKIEAAFRARTLAVEGRAVDREGSALGRIVRMWGTVLPEEHVQLAIFGQAAAALEVGHFGPLRASEGFAEKRLHRASPALAAPPLVQASLAAGAAPVRFFIPGPFAREGGDRSAGGTAGLGGLLSDVAAATLTVTPSAPPGEPPALVVRVILTGVWTADRSAAAGDLFLRHFKMLVETPPGKLIGADAFLLPPTVAAHSDTLVLTARYDAQALARRLHLAVEGPLGALLSPRAEPAD